MNNSILFRSLNVTVLIADNYIDNFMHRKLLESMNISNKYMEFSDPAEAINYLKIVHDLYDKSGGNSIDLIIFDMNTSRMDAKEFLKQIEVSCIYELKTKIIFITDLFNEKEIELLRSEDLVSGIIQKPLDPVKIIDCFKTIPSFELIP